MCPKHVYQLRSMENHHYNVVNVGLTYCNYSVTIDYEMPARVELVREIHTSTDPDGMHRCIMH